MPAPACWPAQSATRLYWQQEGPMFSYSLLFVVCMYIISYHIISYHIILGAGPQCRLPLVLIPTRTDWTQIVLFRPSVTNFTSNLLCLYLLK